MHYLTLLKGKAYCDIYCKRITFNVKFRYVYVTFIGVVVAIINLNNKNNHHFKTLTTNDG
ncbi:Uncharacterised protein [Staphylococcus aureus]|uniref:Uncharacterized protein n=1 Tax=Staphylococcus aureus TaxID=1280 RepID=A0A2X2JSU7_STAAU|nr:Uncharacterised protein [Staphylococcus aureus]